MSRPPMVLETKRLLLREMNPDDFHALFLVLSDPETMWHYPYTFDGQHVKDWIERNMNRYRTDGFGLWAVCLKQSGEMIGDCGLTLQNINGTILPEIGYHIRHDCQRMGYASEAAKAVRNWAFRNTDYSALYSYCKYTNEPSIKTAESIGMHFVCEYPDEANGTTHVSAISRKEWLNEITEIMETQRLILDSIRESDKQDYFNNISHDKKVLETFICRYAETMEEFDFSSYSGRQDLFAIRLKETGRLIGIINYFDEKDGSCEIGYGIGSGYWNRGYATEAVHRFLEFLFREKGLKNVYASFFTGNVASRRVMEKCGMHYSHFTERELTYLDVPRDLTYYVIQRGAI